MYEIPFFKPNLDEIDPNFLSLALSEKSWTLLEKLESSAAKLLGTGYAVAVTNPASALHLSLCALDLKRGDKVICSTNAHPAVSGMIRHFDSEPIFVDIDPVTYNMDLDKLEEVLTNNDSKKLRGVIVNFISGTLIDLNRLYRLAKQYEIFVIEEASGAFGIKHKGYFVGSLDADITVVSFSPMSAKTSANIGILLTRDKSLCDRAKLIRHHAIDKSHSANIDYAFDIVDAGFAYTPSPLDLSYALSEMEKYDQFLAVRAEIAKTYSDELAGVDHITLPNGDGVSANTTYIIQVDKNRDDFARELFSRGVETSLTYSPLHMMSYYRTKYGIKITDYPVSLNSYQHILSLPIYSSLSEDAQKAVISAVKEVAAARVW